MIKDKTQLKKLEGKIVWLLPTGNRARRDPCTYGLPSATVTKVARVFVTLTIMVSI